MTEEEANAAEALEKKSATQTEEDLKKAEEEKKVDLGKKEGEENKTLDWYEGELKRVNEAHEIDLKIKQEVIDHKNRAIDSLKKPKEKDEIKADDEETVVINNQVYKKSDVETIQKIAKEAANEDLGKKIDTLMETFTGSQVDQLVSQMTENVSERELIKMHYKNSIKPTGDLKEDLKNARLLANKAFIFNEGLKEGQENSREDVIASFSTPKTATRGGKGGDELDENDPAVQIVKSVNPEALKNPEVRKKLLGH